MNAKISKDRQDQLLGAAAVVGVVVVGSLILKRKVNRKAVQLAAEMSANAVQAWVSDHEAMGLSVLLLPAKLTEQMFLEAQAA